jgi:hypothetical protein
MTLSSFTCVEHLFARAVAASRASHTGNNAMFSYVHSRNDDVDVADTNASSVDVDARGTAAEGVASMHLASQL